MALAVGRRCLLSDKRVYLAAAAADGITVLGHSSGHLSIKSTSTAQLDLRLPFLRSSANSQESDTEAGSVWLQDRQLLPRYDEAFYGSDRVLRARPA